MTNAHTFLNLQLITSLLSIYIIIQAINHLYIYNTHIIKIQQMKTARPVLYTPNVTNNSLSSSHPHHSQLVDSQLKTKFNTFLNWDAKSYLKNRRMSKTNKKQQAKQQQNVQIFQALLKFANDIKKKQQYRHKKRSSEVGRVEVSNRDNRQKFKKIDNPLQFIKYYIQNNRFQPNQDQQKLVDKLVQIKAVLQSMQNINLDKVLEQIYELMNMSVDCNQLKLLILATILAADICLQSKDINRAFYFYNQARLASLYSGSCEITVQSLIGMAKIAHQLGHTNSSLKLLKKSLAYAWRVSDNDSEIQIYDLMGQNYCEQGKMEKADYYHQRFARNQTEKQKSVIKKIYFDIIKQDAKNRNLKLYNDDVDMLLLETLNLPIYSFDVYPAFETKQQKGNYINGESPRKYITKQKFTYSHFQSAQFQISKVVMQAQFQKQMPNPDIQIPFIQTHRYAKKNQRDVDFSRTLQFHKIIGAKMEPSPIKVSKKYSIEKQIQLMMAQKPDPLWFQKMSNNVKQQRQQKLGSLKGTIRKSHLKIQKQKRSLSAQSQRIRNSVNKAILNWIDPLE